MSFGLLIRDEDGNVILDADTFTVRLVATVSLGAGQFAGPVRLPCPAARAGMFAATTPLAVWSFPQVEPWERTSPGAKLAASCTPMPIVTVENGAVVCSPPRSRTVFKGPLLIYVLTNV
ncbi:hypothetical protein PA6_009_00200 [Aquipseudomonas alcaligenes NBRC 14159]|uniref:Uncharacterized protein n=1 Tax=Aquipseudomonas alcaligenes (strain ATCC 14909 / DSM 50342 / CCUG 1425 / JCM 20561 / NBRC 14159 / NCIMB 9945 / NCTC 10367 / 1577) TaxID=1215092 RepID=U2ZLT3_AQUA1|nr:hypothetical protein PA6_009_00200 [Pseudomonas alcaligenes NBRC 14159]